MAQLTNISPVEKMELGMALLPRVRVSNHACIYEVSVQLLCYLSQENLF